MQYQPTAIILADSISPNGIRLTTFQLTYWRAIHSELMTHRMFSRCAQSSRATPIKKNIEAVLNNPWRPAVWTANDKGMVAKQNIPEDIVPVVELAWKTAAKSMATIASALEQIGVHKQVVNRLLEPFSSINVVVSSTDWNNFWKLRCAKDADPSMQLLANTMKEAFDASEPKKLFTNDWHLPYIDREKDMELVKKQFPSLEEWEIKESIFPKISAARCARVSYKTFDGTTSIKQDIELCDRLIKNNHMSPLEHIAKPDIYVTETEKNIQHWLHSEEHGNFRGWRQLRKMMPNEYIVG